MKSKKEIESKLTKLNEDKNDLEVKIKDSTQTIEHLNTFIPKLEAIIAIGQEINKKIGVFLDNNAKENSSLSLDQSNLAGSIDIFNKHKDKLINALMQVSYIENVYDQEQIFLNEQRHAFMNIKTLNGHSTRFFEVINNLMDELNSSNFQHTTHIINKLKPFLEGKGVGNYLYTFTENIKNELRKAQTIKENSGKELERINAAIESLNKELTTTNDNPSMLDARENISAKAQNKTDKAGSHLESLIKKTVSFSQELNTTELDKYKKIAEELAKQLVEQAEKLKQFVFDNKIKDISDENVQGIITRMTKLNYDDEAIDLIKYIASDLCLASGYSENAEYFYKKQNGHYPYKFANDNNNFFINFINKLSQLIHNVLVYLNIKKQTVPPELTEIQANLTKIKGAVKQHQKDLQPKPTSPQ